MLQVYGTSNIFFNIILVSRRNLQINVFLGRIHIQLLVSQIQDSIFKFKMAEIDLVLPKRQ